MFYILRLLWEDAGVLLRMVAVNATSKSFKPPIVYNVHVHLQANIYAPNLCIISLFFLERSTYNLCFRCIYEKIV